MPDLLRRRLALLGHADDAITAHGNAQGVGRNGDRRLYLKTTGGYQLAILIDLE
ncbi:hypothetical protein D3C80_2039080 [compost metagenome]